MYLQRIGLSLVIFGSPTSSLMNLLTGARHAAQTSRRFLHATLSSLRCQQKSFGVGYQVGLAASQKKPTLLLRREGISREAFLGGLDNSYVQKAEYTVDTIDGIIGHFLEKDEESVKDIRFNLLIDRKLNAFLKKSAIDTGKTKAEIIRELLAKEMGGSSTNTN